MSDHDSMFRLIGLYIVHWSSVELAVDIATVKVAAGTAESVISSTGGLSISKKISNLKDLVAKGDMENKDKILKLLSEIPEKSIRNSISHSYMNFMRIDGENCVEFIHIKNKKLKKIRLTESEFLTHMKFVCGLAEKLAELFGNTECDANKFIRDIEGVFDISPFSCE